jgi:hypothetical protein
MSTEAYAELSIYGDFKDCAEITRALGLEPTTTGRRGEPTSLLRVARKHDVWCLKRVAQAGEDLTTAAEALMGLFKGKGDALAALRKSMQLEVVLSCVMYSDTANPGFFIAPETVEACCDLGAGIDVDVYCMSEDD